MLELFYSSSDVDPADNGFILMLSSISSGYSYILLAKYHWTLDYLKPYSIFELFSAIVPHYSQTCTIFSTICDKTWVSSINSVWPRHFKERFVNLTTSQDLLSNHFIFTLCGVYLLCVCVCVFFPSCLFIPFFLIMFSLHAVPCLRRVASIEEEYEAAGGEVLLDNEDTDGWLATHGKPKGIYSLLVP